MVPELFHKELPESLYRGYRGSVLPMVSGFVGNLRHLSTLRFLMCIKLRTAYQPNFPLVYKIWESIPPRLSHVLICQCCEKPKAASGTPPMRMTASGVFLQIPIV